MRHLISLKDQSKEDLFEILDLAKKLKDIRKKGEVTELLKGKTLIMLFQKTSTRTRISFEAAMTELGGHAIYVDQRNTQIAMADFRDEIQAIMRYGHVLMFRALKADDVELAASFNRIPVIDGCSEKYHPCQALGDVLTMIEDVGVLENIKKVAWICMENNVSNTLKLACAKLGVPITIIAPEIDKSSVDEELNKMADDTGLVTYTQDLEQGLKDAQYIHTDTWVNMEFFENGKVKPDFEQELNRRKEKFMPNQMNTKLLEKYAPQAKFMDCMPLHVGYEITRNAIDHPNALFFDQAENRLHIQRAIILWLLEISL